MNVKLWDTVRGWWKSMIANSGERTSDVVVIEALLDLHDRLSAIEERLDRLEDK